MDYHELAGAKFLVQLKGADVSAIASDGVVMWTLGLHGGVHDGKWLMSFMSPGDHLDFGAGVSVLVSTGTRTRRAVYGPLARESGANPDFRPQRLTDTELRLRKLVAEVTAKSDGVERRLKQLERLKAQKAPQPGPAPSPAPEPVAQPEGTLPEPEGEVVGKPEAKKDGAEGES